MTFHPELIRIALGVDELHKYWKPHDAQVEIGKALIRDRIKNVFAQCGRNLGKTELVAYLLWRWAYTFPGSENYYFSPYMKQSREILWSTRRVQTLGPEDWIDSIQEHEMRIRFTNGSFIKLDGSDNVEAYRGVKPKGLTVFDEFKDFRPEFFEAYDPNRAAFDSPLLIIGTPPEFEGQFTKIYDAWSKDQETKRVFKFPTHANPHISKAWLEQKKNELYARGEGDKWEREYLAESVRGGSKRIFPMLKNSHVKNHGELMLEILKDKKKLEWFCWADPAGASCFAVLFGAINPYTKVIYLLDEIYETRQEEMTVQKIGQRILQMTKQLYQYEWRYGYDEAETWFSNEMLHHFELSFEPTQKAKNDKTTGLSLIKDAFLQDKIKISSRCVKLFWELDNYRKDDEGRIIKKNDHLIDCLRYILAANHYNLNDNPEYKEANNPDFRGARIEDDFPGFTETGDKVDQWEDSIW